MASIINVGIVAVVSARACIALIIIGGMVGTDIIVRFAWNPMVKCGAF